MKKLTFLLSFLLVVLGLSAQSNPYGLDDSAPLTTLNETFESGIPASWKNVAVVGDRTWENKSFGGNSYAQMSAFKGTGVYQTLLISPAIDFDKIDKANVKFDWKSAYTNGATLTVYVMSKDGTKTEVKTINDNANPGGYGQSFNTETLDLSAFSGVQFLAFEYNGEAGVKTTTYQVDNVIAENNAAPEPDPINNPYGLDDSAPLTTLNETFESGIPASWKNVAVVGDRTWENKSFGGNSYAQMSAFKGTGVYQTLLISPAIDFDKIDKANVKFDWKSAYTNGATLTVYVMSKDGTKTEVKTINDNANPGGYGQSFNTETLDLSAFSGVQFLAFEYNGEAGVKTTTYQVDNVVTDVISGVSTPKFNALSAWTSADKICFNATAGEVIDVYNVAGQKVVSRLAADGLNEVAVQLRGVAIVKVGNCISKVIL